MSDLVGVVRRYYDACNSGNLDEFAATLDPEVVHYFLSPNVGSAAVGPRERLVSYWTAVQPRIAGLWVVDHALRDDAAGEVVIEWSLFWTPPDGDRVVTRGAEWFGFREDRILEIRSYYQQRPDQDTQLEAFGYAERGYSLHRAEHSRIHDPAAALRTGANP